MEAIQSKVGIFLQVSDDVVLIQPLSYPMEGLGAAQDEFRRLFRWIPDLHGDIEDWGGAWGHTLHLVYPDGHSGSQYDTALAPGGSI